MKKALKIIAIILVAVILAAIVVLGWHYPGYVRDKESVKMEPAGEGISMMSCNLRCLTPLDLGHKSWFYRADLLLEDIASAAPGIIGFQEATRWQYKYMVDCLEGYDSVITYRDKSPVSEGCPVFYNMEMYELKDKGSFWLSEPPETMSRDWGSACYRICSYVILTDKVSGEDFVVFNTHLYHVSDEARIKGIEVVLDKIAEFGGLPAVIMGDFNAEEGSETYTAVTENFLDAVYELPEPDMSITFQNWGNPDREKRIDYFMVSMTGFEVLDYEVILPVHDGVYASDHCPLVLRVEMGK